MKTGVDVVPQSLVVTDRWVHGHGIYLELCILHTDEAIPATCMPQSEAEAQEPAARQTRQHVTEVPPRERPMCPVGGNGVAE